MKEERISQRVEIELPAHFSFKEDPRSWFEATVMNISSHGFCFRTEAKHNEAFGEKPVIRLSIGLSEKERVELNVQVAWSGKTSSYNSLVGGKILNPSGEDYQKILEFYTKLFRTKPEEKDDS